MDEFDDHDLIKGHLELLQDQIDHLNTRLTLIESSTELKKARALEKFMGVVIVFGVLIDTVWFLVDTHAH